MADLPSDLSPRPISRISTAVEVADSLREQILLGELAPGARLPEIPLAAAFHVSRNTLRDAFRLLEREGLVEHLPHRGGFVAQLAEPDIRDLYRIRRILEISGARNVSAASEAARERLRAPARRCSRMPPSAASGATPSTTTCASTPASRASWRARGSTPSSRRSPRSCASASRS